ncbi:hypothetical protein CHS0354_002850, partial [Potamilus streckersoni]
MVNKQLVTFSLHGRINPAICDYSVARVNVSGKKETIMLKYVISPAKVLNEEERLLSFMDSSGKLT